MIIELAIKQGENFTHSGKNCTEFGNHFDGENFYFFESEDERIYFFDKLKDQEDVLK